MADKVNTSRPYSGVNEGSDPTNEPGQYPVGGWGDAIFGGPLPSGTGAPGSPGGGSGATDATNEPGQTQDGLTGISESEIVKTGAPGTQGAVDTDSGADSITYTVPGAGISGNNYETVSDNVSGPRDWTGANDGGYATGGPQLPGLAGNEPEAGRGQYQPGAGRVMRGGRAVKG